MLSDLCRTKSFPFSFAFDDIESPLFRPVLTRIVFSISRIIFLFFILTHIANAQKIPFFNNLLDRNTFIYFCFCFNIFFISVFWVVYIRHPCCSIERSPLPLSCAFQFYDNSILYFYAFIFLMLLHWNLVAIGRRWHLHNYRDFVLNCFPKKHSSLLVFLLRFV